METRKSSAETDDWVEKIWFNSYLKAQENRMKKEKNDEDSESL